MTTAGYKHLKKWFDRSEEFCKETRKYLDDLRDSRIEQGIAVEFRYINDSKHYPEHIKGR